MATTNQKDIKLIIRAEDLSKATLKDTSKNVDAVTDALEGQIAAAKRGEVSAGELRDTLKELANAEKALVSAQGAVDYYNRLAAELTSASEKADKARATQAAFAEEMAKTETVTAKQTKQLAALALATERAEKALTTTTSKLSTQGEKLRAVGISVESLATSQAELVSTAQKTGTALGVVGTALMGYNRNLRETNLAEKALADEAVFQKKLQDSSKLLKAGEYVRFWTNSLEAMEVAERASAEETRKVSMAQAESAKAAQMAFEARAKLQAQSQAELAAFRLLAAQTVATARGYNTLSDSTVKLATANSRAAASVNEIVNPTEQARTTLAGLEKQVEDTAKSIGKIAGPFKDYAQSVRELQAAQKSASSQAGSIDMYRNQVASVRAARAAFVEARADVLKYANAIRVSAAPSDELAVGSRKAQQALAASSREFQIQVDRARALKAELANTGISTRNLAEDEARLASTARQATTALTRLGAAHNTHNLVAGRTGGILASINRSSRESLGWYQRVRGEVIAVATAYVGFQGAISLAGKAIDSYIDKQVTLNRLSVIVGTNTGAMAKEYQYIWEQAKRLGVGIKELAAAYTSFAIAAKSANLSAGETKYAFERITEGMRVIGADDESIKRAFVQLQQMLSKTVVQLEDLRQAAEGGGLPGLAENLARGLGLVNTQQLFEGLKKGSIDAKVAVLALAGEMDRQFSDKLPQALKSLQAEQGRFSTSVQDFQRLIAESGFADAYTDLLRRLSAFFASSDGTKFAKDISTGFNALIQVVITLVNHLREVQYALAAAFGYAALRTIVSVGAAIYDTAKGVVALGTAYKTAAAAQAALTAAQAGSAAATAAGGAATAATVSKWAKLGTIVGVIGRVVTVAAVGLAGMAAAAAAFVAALPAAGIAAVVVGVAALGAAIVGVTLNFDEVQAAAEETWRKLPYNAAIARDQILLAFSVMGDMMAPSWKSVKDWAAATWTDIKYTASRLWMSLVSGASGAKDGLATQFSKVGTMIANSLERSGIPIRSWINSVKSSFEGIYTKAMGIFSRITSGAKRMLLNASKATVEYLKSKMPELSAESKALLDSINKNTKERDAGPKPKAVVAPAEANLVAKNQAAMAKIEAHEKKVNDILDDREAARAKIRAANLAGTLKQVDAEKQIKKVNESFRAPIKAAQVEAGKLAVALDGAVPQGKLEDFLSKMEGAGGLYAKANTSAANKPDTKALSAANARQNAEAALNAQLVSLTSTLDKKEADNLDERLANVGKEFDILRAKIAKFQKQGGTKINGVSLKNVAASVNELEAQKRIQVEREFYRKREEAAEAKTRENLSALGKQEQAVNDAVKTRSEAIQLINDQIADGTIDQLTGYELIKAKVAELNPGIVRLADSAAAFATTMRGAIDDTKLDSFMAKTARIKQQASDSGTNNANGAAGVAGKAIIDAGQKELNDVIKERNDLVATYAKLVELGAMTTAEAQTKTEEAYLRTQPVITSMVDELQALLNRILEAGDITPQKFAVLTASLEETRAGAEKINTEFVKIKTSISGAFVSGVKALFGEVSSSIAEAARGTQSWSDTFKDIGSSAQSFLANFILKIGEAILEVLALKAAMAALEMINIKTPAKSSGGGGGTGNFFAAIANAFVSHSGSVVGQGNVKRNAPSSWFEGAPRYHTGYTPTGLRANEHAAILEKNEEVLSKDDPRNVMNAAKRAGTPAPATSLQQNLFFDPNEIHRLSASPAGQQTTMTVIKANIGTIKQMINS